MRLPSSSNGERRLTWNCPGHESGRFTAVILAVGFGIEKQQEGIPFCSYWKNNGLDHRWRKSNRSKFHYLVSGTGDGGLVDLLRICLKDFQHERIVKEFLSDPSLADVKAALRDIEDKFWEQMLWNVPIQPDGLYELYREPPVSPAFDKLLQESRQGDTSVLTCLERPTKVGTGAISRVEGPFKPHIYQRISAPVFYSTVYTSQGDSWV